jgi:hypothetical protein
MGALSRSATTLLSTKRRRPYSAFSDIAGEMFSSSTCLTTALVWCKVRNNTAYGKSENRILTSIVNSPPVGTLQCHLREVRPL